MGSKIEVNKNDVYLYIEDLTECAFELWEVEGRKDSSVKVKIPIKEWKRIVKSWEISKNDKKPSDF